MTKQLMMTTALATVLASGALIASQARAGSLDSEDYAKVSVQGKYEVINERYREKYQKLEREADKLDDYQPSDTEAIIGIKVDCPMKMERIVFDTPSVDMRMNVIKFDVPKTTFKLRRFSFDIPEFRWGRTSIGPVKLDLPKIYSKRVEFKTKIPEFVWDTTTIKTKTPEFYMHRQEIKTHVPKCKVVDVKAKLNEMEQDGVSLESRMNEVRSAHEAELVDATEASFEDVRADLLERREAIVANFETAEKRMQAGIEKIEYYNMDPTKVRNEDGSLTNFVKKLEELQKQKAEALADIDASIAELKEQEQKVIAEMTTTQS